MGKSLVIKVDSQTAVYHFVNLIRQQADVLGRAAARDAKAIEILSAGRKAEVRERAEREADAGDNERILRAVRARKWTRRDQQRMRWIRGHRVEYPTCRVARLLGRFGLAHLDAYRRALDETRRNGTASVVAPLLAATKEAHDALLNRAGTVAKCASLPLETEMRDSLEPHAAAVAAMLQVLPSPQPPEPDDPKHKKIKPTASTVKIIRQIEAGKSNDEVRAATGTSVRNARTVRSRLKNGEYEI